MARAYRNEELESAVAVTNMGSGPAFLSLLFVLLVATIAIYSDSAPRAVPDTAAVSEFSSARALRHLRIIAARPHPIGSSEHDSVRDYIIKELSALGLTAEVQTTTAVGSSSVPPFVSGTVENIFARLRGTDGGKAVLIAGHYDSVPTGPGASDDGSAVVAMLESLRALSAGPQLRNDVIFAFTDGEEVGLLGARAFVDEHPWAKDARVALNFEARGNAGASIMFETSSDNGWLINRFAQGAPYPVANSLSYEIYKRLPNDTDFTVFRSAGLSGLNFAYIDGLNHYHTGLDDLASIDERSLQHQGSYMLALARHFGNANLDSTTARQPVYFDLIGSMFIYYSGGLVIPFTAAVSLFLATVIVVGLRRKHLTVGGIVLALLAFLLSSVVGPLVVTAVWWVIRALHGGFATYPWNNPYNGVQYLISSVALAIAVASALHILYRKKVSLLDLTAGAIVWWLGLLIAASLLVPGGSYLFTWPLLASTIGFGCLLVLKDHDFKPWIRFAVLSVCAIPAIIILSPVIHTMFIALTIQQIGVVIVLLMLLLGLLIPHMDMLTDRFRWLFPGAAALASLVVIVIGSLTSGYDAKHRKTDSIFYALNADAGESIWASTDQRVDEWTSQFLSSGVMTTTLPEFFPSSSRQFLKAHAPSVALLPPKVELLSETTSGEVAALKLRIISARQSPTLSVFLETDAKILSAYVNGKHINYDGGSLQRGNTNQWSLRYYALPKEGVEVSLEIMPSRPLKVRVVDQSFGLPDVPGENFKVRPDYVMPTPIYYTDSTMVSKSFTFLTRPLSNTQ